MSNTISAIRQDYLLASLQEEDTFDDPILQFQKWFQEAIDSAIDEVNAMTLATVDASHKPHARIVLLKGVEENQFVFSMFSYHNQVLVLSLLVEVLVSVEAVVVLAL
jgi:pyridoxamine 5'-phosphate oxidase